MYTIRTSNIRKKEPVRTISAPLSEISWGYLAFLGPSTLTLSTTIGLTEFNRIRDILNEVEEARGRLKVQLTVTEDAYITDARIIEQTAGPETGNNAGPTNQ